MEHQKISFGLVLAFSFLLSNFASASDPAESQVFVPVSKKLMPSVVNIFTTSTVKSPFGGGGRFGGQDDLWRRFFEDFLGEPFGGDFGPGGPQDQEGPSRGMPKAMSLGSGFVIEKTSDGGLILTNNHVVEGADEIKIKFTETSSEKESEAEIIGRDPDLDVALLKVKTKRSVQAVNLGDSDKLEVGEWIGAMGNPFGHGHTFTHGIVSARERSLPGSFANYLQVDAPINPGNSGGPLVNLKGEVVGINNAIDARGPGIGFAIPINLVKAVLPQLKEKGVVERGYIGIAVDELRPELTRQLKLKEDLRGPIVTHVIPGQGAEKAGIKPYDVITEINSKPVYSARELVGAITAVPIGTKIKVKVNRSGKDLTFEVMSGKRPGSRIVRARTEPKKKRGNRIYTGVTLEPLDPDINRELNLPAKTKGVVVSQIDPGSPAFDAGLRRGDVILEVDRKSIKKEDDFYRIVKSKRAYLLRVRKLDDAGQEGFVVLTLDLGKKSTPEDEE